MTVTAAVGEAGMRLVRLLTGRPPQSVEDLIDALGVTRSAVTLQLDELIAAGCVEFSQEKLPGRGRPRNLYSATPTALTELFRGNHWLVVPALWRAIEAVGGDEGDKITRRHAAHLARKHPTLNHLKSSLRKRGLLE